MMVHLVLAALRAVAGEAQGLVGQELSATRVEGSADGNATKSKSVWAKCGCASRRRKKDGVKTCADGSRGRMGRCTEIETYPRTIPNDKKGLETVNIHFSGSDIEGRTERDQLRGDLLEAAQTLRNGVGCR